MVRIDDLTIYDPFGWRTAELADTATGRQRRRQLREDLLVWEAEEVLHGYRHLTIVHGDPDTLEAGRLLSALYDRVRVLAARATWARVRGTADHVTVTVHGPDADDVIGAVKAIADEFDQGDWTVTPSAYPPGIVAA